MPTVFLTTWVGTHLWPN